MVSRGLFDGLRPSIWSDRHNEDLHKQTEVVYSRALIHSCFAITLSDHFASRYHEYVAFVAFQRAFSPSRIPSKQIEKRLAGQRVIVSYYSKFTVRP